jgi:hypothetical protein
MGVAVGNVDMTDEELVGNVMFRWSKSEEARVRILLFFFFGWEWR